MNRLPFSSRARRVLVPTLLAALVVATGSLVPAQAFVDGHTKFSSAPSPMGQTNGPVFATAIVGSRIYVGGTFDAIRPAGSAVGSNETAVGNIAAFDKATGAPVTSFSPKLFNAYSNTPGTVNALVASPDGTTLYAGGDFTTVNGSNDQHIAAFDAATGAWKGMVGWNGVNGNVRSLAISPDGNTLYVGGGFTSASYSPRTSMAAINLRTGAPTSFNPVVTTPVQSQSVTTLGLAVSADGSKVFGVGPFRTVNGLDRQGFVALNAATGATVTGFAGPYFYAPYSFGTSVAVAGDTVYTGGRDDITSTGARTEGVFSINAATGAKNWYANCYGDTFAVLPVNDEIYVGSHAHDCSSAGGMPEGSTRNYVAINVIDKASGKMKPYFVQTQGAVGVAGSYLLSRALSTDGNQLVMGGGFVGVNFSEAQANVSRFPIGSASPSKPYAAASTCAGCSTTTLKIYKSIDRDDIKLSYRIYRGYIVGNAPIATVAVESLPWPSSTFTYTDTGVKSGDSVFYKVVAVDPAGNIRGSDSSARITVGSP